MAKEAWDVVQYAGVRLGSSLLRHSRTDVGLYTHYPGQWSGCCRAPRTWELLTVTTRGLRGASDLLADRKAAAGRQWINSLAQGRILMVGDRACAVYWGPSIE